MRTSIQRATLVSLFLTAAAVAQTASEGTIQLLGVVSYPLSASASPVAAPQAPDNLVRVAPHFNFRAGLAKTAAAAPAVALTNPDPTPKAVVRPDEEFTGFAGLTHFDTRTASNGNQFSTEPPDQGLAVGNGYVFEVVNSVVGIYSKSGVLAAPPVALNAFYGLPPEITRGTPNVYGPSVGDPRVYYDQQIRRWFLTSYEADTNSATGAFTGPSHVLLAVSQTSNPAGSYFVYAIPTTDDGTGGTPSHPNCPCFPDQPLNGADANGFYITTNEFPQFVNGFNGAQVYATSKGALAAGTPGTLVHFDNIPLAESIAYSIQPARSLSFGRRDVEYFLSALDFLGTLDNRIALWAVLNTDTLTHKHPSLKLLSRVLSSETYGMPVVGAAQPPGPTPLGTLVGEPEETLASNDDRMNQVVFENGLLWSGVNTVVGGKSTSVRNGIAYFVVAPAITDSKLSGAIAQQGYVAAPGQDSVLFPSIGVSEESAAMTFTLVGPTASRTGSAYFPSMAFTRLNRFGGAGDIELGAAGAAPEDGFSGYMFFGGGGVARWGDYSAATADEDGSIWLAAEWIPNSPRTTLANWGTFIGKLGE
jgi:hypothetical protein